MSFRSFLCRFWFGEKKIRNDKNKDDKILADTVSTFFFSSDFCVFLLLLSPLLFRSTFGVIQGVRTTHGQSTEEPRGNHGELFRALLRFAEHLRENHGGTTENPSG